MNKPPNDAPCNAYILTGFAMLESLSAKAVTKGWTIQGLEFDEEEFEEQAEMLKKRSIKNILVFFTNEEQLAGLVNTVRHLFPQFILHFFKSIENQINNNKILIRNT